MRCIASSIQLFFFLIILSVCLFFSAPLFADDYVPENSSSNLTAEMGYIALPNLPPGGDLVNPIRLAAIRQASMSLGARGGLAWEAHVINQSLESESVFIDQVFDFNLLLLEHNVLPPVLTQSDRSLNLADNETLRIDEKTYQILNPARFVTAPPNWRNYLWLHFQKPDIPDRSLLPQTRAEAQVWNHYLRQGWTNGIEQAQAIFSANLNRLKRDMLGMILYRILLAEHMVSAPFVAKAQLGVTGDTNQLRINDQVLRITAQSQLQTDSKKWKPVLTK